MTALIQFRQQMTKMHGEYDQVLPAHMDVGRLERMVFNAVQGAEKRNGGNYLLEADRRSLLASVMTAAVLGLEPDGVTGQGYLVPFKGKVQFIVGYGGYVSLAANSGILLEGRIVHEGDIFSYQYGSDPQVNHAPAQGLDIDKRGRLTAAYAVARSNNLPTTFHVMELADILKVRDSSKGYQSSKNLGRSSPWDTDFPAMARKTPLRWLGKNMPLTVQKAQALERALDAGRTAYLTPENVVLEEE
jgi:recombination protein RecT